MKKLIGIITLALSLSSFACDPEGKTGFLPDNNLSLIIDGKFQQIVLSVSMLLSFFSLFLLYNLVFFKKKNINFLFEDLYLLFYLIFLIAIFFIFFNFKNNFSLLFLSICSSISNIGFSLDVPQNLTFIFIIMIIIGGSFFSTSSGLRFSKLFLLFKFSMNELVSHAKPKNVHSNKLSFFNIYFENEDFFICATEAKPINIINNKNNLNFHKIKNI